jgi:hypothetical protein
MFQNNLFNNSNNLQQQQPQTNGLFGGLSNTGTTTNGMFGNGLVGVQQPTQQTNNLWGNSNPINSQGQKQMTGSFGNIFGGGTSTLGGNNSNPNQGVPSGNTNSMFGSTTIPITGSTGKNMKY